MLIAKRLVVGVAAAGGAAAAIAAVVPTSGSAPRAPTARASTAVTVELRSPIPGGLLLLAGPEYRRDSVYRVDPAGEVHEVAASRPHSGLITSFAFGGSRLAYSHHEDLGPDELVVTGRGAHKGRRLGKGHDPDLAPDGSLVYVQPRIDGDRGYEVLRVLERKRKPRLIRIPGNLYTPRWAPDGSIMVLNERRDRTWIVLNAGKRRQRRIRAVPRTPGQLNVSSRGTFAHGYAGDIAIFSRRGRLTRRHRVPWIPIAWTPRGDRLLVTRQDGRLGLLHPVSGRVRVVGRVIGGTARAAVWAER